MRKLEITVHEDAIQARRGSTEMPQRFRDQFRGLEYGKIVAINANKTYNVQIADRAFPLTGVMVSNPKAIFRLGDQVVIGHLEGNQYLPFIFSRSANINAQDVRRPAGPVILGLLGNWSQGQGCPALTGLTNKENAAFVIDSGTASSYVDLGPGHNSLPVLGHVVFESEANVNTLAILWQKRRATDVYGLELTAFEHSLTVPMSQIWTMALGTGYALPTGLELELDYRDGFLIHDRSTRQLCAFGNGTAELRNTAFIVGESGSLAYSGSFGQRAHQSTFFAGRLIKCWHSFLRPGESSDSLRETQDSLIRAFKKEGTGLISAWTLNPQTLLPTCQISTSEAHYGAADDKGQGRWPISVSGKRMVVFVSGSEQAEASGENSLMQLLPNRFASSDVSSAVQYDYGRTKVKKAKIAALNTDTGAVDWSVELIDEADYLIDTDSVDWTDSNVSDPSTSRANFRNLDGVIDSWTPELTYRGFATQLGLAMGSKPYTVSPSTSTLTDPDPGTNEDEYCVYTGSLTGRFEAYSGVAIDASGPDYNFFEAGGIRLFPLPISAGIQASFSLNPENEALIGKNPVGGCMAIDNEDYTFVVRLKTRPVVSGRNGKDDTIVEFVEMEWREISPEEWIPIPPEAQVPGGPTQYLVCAQYAAFAQLELYWMGLVEQLSTILVHLISPTGTDQGVTDVTQYASRQHSSMSWGLITQVYQIIPIYDATVFFLLRDRYLDYPTDTLPSVVVDVWPWGSGGTLIETVVLWSDVSTYYDTELEVTRRRYDQYVEQISPGKGALGSDGYWWVVFRLRVHDRVDDTYSNEWVRLQIDPVGAVTVTVTRWSTTDGATWPGTLGQHTSMAIAGDRSITSTDSFNGTENTWRVLSKSFI